MKDQKTSINGNENGNENEAEMEQTVEIAGEPVAADGAAVVEGGTPEERVVPPEERIAELEALLAERNDQYLRKAADFENYRKRMAKEKAEAIDFANVSLILDLIPVLDDFERALKSASDAQNAEGADLAAAFKSLFEGIGMTESRLYSTLENKWGLKRYVSAGKPFDPELHEALMMEKSADTPEAVVQEEFVKGYSLKGRVIRAAKVKVLMPS